VENDMQNPRNNYGKKIGDTPTDNLQLVPRKYVNLNGTLANRPASILAQIGQQYYATDINVPIFYDGSEWRNGIGSILASN
jgi:hypothetical protein